MLKYRAVNPCTGCLFFSGIRRSQWAETGLSVNCIRHFQRQSCIGTGAKRGISRGERPGLEGSIVKTRVCPVIVAIVTSLSIAAVGLASPASPSMVGLIRSGSNQPRTSTWSGSSWSSSAAITSVGQQANWVVMKTCPTRNETVCVTLDQDDDVNVQFHNGSSWGSVTEVCTNTTQNVYRCIDVAYEQSSGDMLLVYWRSASSRIGYRTYSGSSVSSESTLTPSDSATVNWMALVAKPGSDEITLLCLNTSNRLYAYTWNGSSFGSSTTLTTSAQTNTAECFAGAYETRSGDLLVVYSESGTTSPRYRTYTGTWSSQLTAPNVGAGTYWVRLAADPLSDRILFGSLDSDADVNVNEWSGTAWGTNAEVEVSSSYTDRRCFDVAYDPAGCNAVAVYTDGTTTMRYRTWNGAFWSPEYAGPNFSAAINILQAVPGSRAGEIIVVGSNSTPNVRVCQWDGEYMSSLTTLESSSGGLATSENFMFTSPPLAAPTPANVPLVQTFEGSVGAEWSPTTVQTNATLGKFAGRYRGSPLRLALNTTIGQTYSLTFDLYAIDSWDGNANDGTGPDNLVVSANGTTILSHTFNFEWQSYGQSYPYVYDQFGAYGWNSTWKDGVYRCVQAVFTATSPTTTLSFFGQLADESNQGFNDESFGIDNVSVTTARFVNVTTAQSFGVSTSSDPQEGSGHYWADFNGDGTLDALLTGTTARMLVNNNKGATTGFSSTSLGLVREQGGMADFDNDGDIDFYSGEYNADGGEQYMRNNGSASFTAMGHAGMSSPGTNEGTCAVDVNRDGWCDVIIFSGNNNWLGTNQKSTTVAFTQSSSGTYGLNGSGNFGSRGYVATGDVNRDGYADIFYRYNGGRLFLSKADGTYTQNAKGISVTAGGFEYTAAAWGDYDNDGDLDLFVPDLDSSKTGTLWRNDVTWSTSTGTGNFTNVTTSAGLGQNATTSYSPAIPGTRSVCWGDYDNDGDLDLFVLGSASNSYFFQNQGNGTFKRVGEGLTITGNGSDCVFVDYDNDGDLDLAITRIGSPAMLWRNNTDNSDYLKVRLVGAGDGRTNKAAIGIFVELYDASGTTLLARRDVGSARGYGGADPMWLHFGGVNASASYKLKVYWDSLAMSSPQVVSVVPSAVSTTFGSNTIPQMITINEPTTAKVIFWREVVN